MDRNVLIETLAEHCHDNQWSGWMKYQFGKCLPLVDGETNENTVYIPPSLYQRWTYQMNTPYSNLPEEMKESDREEARQILDLIDTLKEII